MIVKNNTMAKYTKKWNKEFTKKYSDCLSQLESLEKEFKEMVESNPDKYISIYPTTSNIELGKENGYMIYDFGNDEEPHVDIQLSSTNGSFNFTFVELKRLQGLRDDLIKSIDNFKRSEKDAHVKIDDDCEDEEGWEDNEESEYTIQASRTCVQTWTHTVIARSSCEAYRKLHEDEGSTHDENDDYDQYGEIDWEII
jgi:hypothetical protein